ncbi:MAG: GGDEF domain-containing protein [Desulfobacterales bacterium]|nr:GGDEF domain-containing protein [Desulfobacterales bacterium]MDJ0882958.1 GGDEF domain-containing protein [Desulfobacterales bacterium]
MEAATDFETVLNKSKKLPTLPGIAMKILEAVQKERPDLQEIAEVLSTDPPLSAEVLKLINSPFFGLTRKVTSVFHAVSMLGMNVVKNMALSFALVKNFSNNGQGDFDYPRFWKYSLTTAIAARMIAEKVAAETAEDAFFLGLLHDMGLLALARCLPDQYQLVVQEAEAGNCSNHQAESQILGFDHMAIGRHLVRSWGLPSKFWQPIGCHHCPERLSAVEDETLTLTRVLNLATVYADMFQAESTATYLAVIDHYTKSYGYAAVLDVDQLAVAISEETHRFFPYFDIDFDDDADYLETIERARSELINVSTDFIDQLVAQQRQIDTLRRQATHDGMTQLMNYQYFQETLNREIARSRRSHSPLTVVMADIDRFKAVNDTYGHMAGDHAIKTVATCLQANLRETDHIARYGGEEFALILYNIPPEEALSVTERVRQTISELPIRFDDRTFKITMSFGIASLAGDDQDREALLDNADKALYEAKSAGRNCCRVHRART